MTVAEAEHGAPSDFVRSIVGEDIAAGRTAEIVTRFPPEPNGYLHIGHAKSIVLNFGVARGVRRALPSPLRRHQPGQGRDRVHRLHPGRRPLAGLRLGREHLHFASDHFERLYEWAEHLVREGKAYVDDSSADEIRAMRGTLTEPGYREPLPRPPGRRKISTSCAGCGRARSTKGSRVLRARIDMAARATSTCATRCSTASSGRQPSAHRRCVVHLPDLRFRARTVGRDRGGDALALHARIRRPPPALRLADRQPAGAGAPAPVRVRPPQPRPYGALQAATDPAGRGGACRGLGRSPVADAGGAP